MYCDITGTQGHIDLLDSILKWSPNDVCVSVTYMLFFRIFIYFASFLLWACLLSVGGMENLTAKLHELCEERTRLQSESLQDFPRNEVRVSPHIKLSVWDGWISKS